MIGRKLFKRHWFFQYDDEMANGAHQTPLLLFISGLLYTFGMVRKTSERFGSHVVIGRNQGFTSCRDVVLKAADRRHHCYVIGKTGTGKSTLLLNMLVQDIRAGCGVCFVDPHGESAEALLEYIPKNRIKDVVYFDPADCERPPGLNLLEIGEGVSVQLAASSLISMFRHLFRDFWGPRTEHLLRNAILALMSFPGHTILDLYRILIDENFRTCVLRNVCDPFVKSFWRDEFGEYNDRFRAEVIAPLQNKLGQLVTNPLVRNIVGQSISTFNVRRIMDEGMILIVNLAKGRVGEDASNLLGSLITTQCFLSALARETIPPERRRDFYLYVDEFYNFSTDIFPSILSEARKYRLNLILAHQYMAQLTYDTKHAVLGNVGSIIAFRIGAKDAEELELEFEPNYDIESLRKQNNHEIYFKLLTDGIPAEPSFARTSPPAGHWTVSEASKEEVIAKSKKRFTRNREEVERDITERMIER